MGSLRGAFIGSLLIGIADTFGKAYLPSMALFLIYLVMVAVLLVRPQGLFGIAHAQASSAPNFALTITTPRIYGLIAIVAMVVLPFFVPSYPRELVAEIYIFAIFALSLDLLLGYTGLISLGHAAFFGLDAYGVAILAAHFGISPWIGLGAG
jgi:branched-chain amino acid transport system permease protein